VAKTVIAPNNAEVIRTLKTSGPSKPTTGTQA